MRVGSCAVRDVHLHHNRLLKNRNLRCSIRIASVDVRAALV